MSCRRSTRWLAGAVLAVALMAPPAAGAATPLPAHAYAPYFETWTSDGLTAVASASGALDLTLAFVEAPARGSCTPTWDGDPSQGMDAGRYVADLASLRAIGGDVVPSFGGYSADHSGRDVAEACKTVDALAAAYESVIATYDVSRIDLDVEDRALERPLSIDRRNKALREVEAWAAATGRPLQVEYTLPVEPSGLEANGLAVLRNAVLNGTRVDVVDIMAFDYYDGVTTDMGGAAARAARRLHLQLRTLYPALTSAQRWAMVGITLLPGIDDYPARTEVTSLRDARRIRELAQRVGLSTLSIWAIQRDNGGCPGVIDANDCSGIVQAPWDFSHILAG
jgi:hypothetical protein